MERDPYRTHAYHRFCKQAMQREAVKAMDADLREEYLRALYAMTKMDGPAYVDRSPRLRSASEPWTMPDGKTYIYVKGEAP